MYPENWNAADVMEFEFEFARWTDTVRQEGQFWDINSELQIAADEMAVDINSDLSDNVLMMKSESKVMNSLVMYNLSIEGEEKQLNVMLFAESLYIARQLLREDFGDYFEINDVTVEYNNRKMHLISEIGATVEIAATRDGRDSFYTTRDCLAGLGIPA